MYQKLYVAIVFIASIGGYLYFRNKDIEFDKRDITLTSLGLFFVAINCIAIYLSQGRTTLTKYLLLEDIHVAGKLILIGYVFILLGIFFFIERIIKKNERHL